MQGRFVERQQAAREQVQAARAAQTAEASSQLSALQGQRAELQVQLEQLATRRRELFAQSQTSPESQKAGLEARMTEIDARAARLDRQLESLNDQIVHQISRVTQGGGTPEVRVPEIRIPQINVPIIDVPRGRYGPTGSNDFQAMVAGALIGEAVLFALIGVFAWRTGMKRMREQLERALGGQTQQLNQLQQAVDVIGVEVERISEGQRYVAKVLADGSPVAAAIKPGAPR